MSIEESKGLLKSKTILGAAIAAAPALDSALTHMGLTGVPFLGPILGDFMTIFGAVVAIVGRVQAVARITKVF